VRTCSIGFDEAALDESSHAERVANLFATSHHAARVDPSDFADVDRLAEIFDEPFADASALPTLRVCQLARESVTVALSGDGADEAFVGYRRQVFHAGEERVRSLLPAGFRRAAFGALADVYPKADWAPRPLRAKATLRALACSGEEGYARAVAVCPPELRERLYSPEFLRHRGGYRAEDRWIETMRRAPARSGLDRAQYADLMFWLPGDILTKVDRTSMAASLEAREPLLDHRLVEFAASLPESMRVRRGEGKWLMKRTMRRFLPDDILYRPKQGFVTPIAQWLRGPLAGAARAISSSAPLARSGWFDLAQIGHAAEAHIAGCSDHSRVLWQLLMLDRSLQRLGIG
jgi:asparagine synthase (glutamine-hydrolysing)